MPGTPSLQQTAAHELSLHRFSSRERMIVEAIICCLNWGGYLDASFDELRLILPAERPFDDSEIIDVLGRIQEVEPVGIGTRNLRECLLLQLQHLDPPTRGLATASQVVESYLFNLAERRTEQLLETLQISRGTLAQAIDLIQGLDPEHGHNLAPEPVTYIAPDVIAIEQQRQWTIQLNADLYLSVRLDPSYSTQLKRTRDAESRRYRQKHLQDARWLIRSFDQRH